MGLLYVSGIPLHDDDAELIERSARRHKLARHVPMVNDGTTYTDIFDDGFRVGAPTYKEPSAYWQRVKASGLTELEYLNRRYQQTSLSDDVREAARRRRDQPEQ